MSDLSLPEDLREEVSRLYGYDRISGLSLGGAIKYLPLNPTIILQQSVESYLIQACHFDQVETYSWVHDHLAYRFGIQLAHQPTLINPVTPEKSHLRSNLLCGLYEVIVRNFRHDDHIHICEIGKVWHESQELTSLAIMIYHKDVSNRSQDAWLSAKGIIQ